MIIPDSVTTIGNRAFSNNALTSVAFEGNFGNFDLSIFSSDMFDINPTLATITYCEGTTGWPQGFNNGSTIITSTPVDCSTAPAPDAPTIDSIAAGNGQAIITFTRVQTMARPSPAIGISGTMALSPQPSLEQPAPDAVDIAVDAAGNVYTEPCGNCVPPPSITITVDPVPIDCAPYNVWKTTPDGTSTILETAPGGLYPITLDSAGNVYGTGSGGVWKITPDGISTNLGGGAVRGGNDRC